MHVGLLQLAISAQSPSAFEQPWESGESSVSNFRLAEKLLL